MAKSVEVEDVAVADDSAPGLGYDDRDDEQDRCGNASC